MVRKDNLTGALSAEAQALLKANEQAGRRPVHTLSVEAARQQFQAVCGDFGLPAVALHAVHDASVAIAGGEVPIRVYHPQADEVADTPALIFFHGGGWVIGDLDTHDGICRYLAQATGLALVAVDYPLSPEARFPVAIDQSLALLQRLTSRSGPWGSAKRSLVLTGDSAGANMATVLALMNRDQPFTEVKAQVLFYPTTDLWNRRPSYDRFSDGLTLTCQTMDYFKAYYLADPDGGRDWRASPLLCESLADLPPTLVVTAGHDPLLDEGIAYAERLRQAGGRVRHLHLEQEMHGFLTVGGAITPAAGVLDTAAYFIKELG